MRPHMLLLAVSLLLQQPQAAPVTLLRAAVGPSGQVRNGDYVLDQERTTFDPASDKQVVVLFQWQGAPGLHRMIVTWQSPDGASSSTRPVEYVAQDRRFGGYWPLTLSATTAVGTWNVEATVDGAPAGRLTFTVGPLAGKAVPVKPARQILTQAQLFARLTATFVTLERSTAKGRHLDPAGAVAVGHGRLVTSMAAVDGADVLVAVLPDGTRQPVTNVLAMNRAQDWIVLGGGPGGEIDQTIAAPGGVQVGDRCFSMEAGTGGTRLLVDCAITGRAGTPAGGGRLVATLSAGTGMAGAPVFSEFGELIGIVGGALVPGVSELSDLLRYRAELRGVPIVSITAAEVPPTAAAQPFAEVWARGGVLHALEGREHVVSGGFAKGILKDSSVRPADQRDEFSSRDKDFTVFITWGPQARLKGLSTLRFYDAANRLLGETKPLKLDVRPGYPSILTSWKVGVPSSPGIYRADVLIDGTPIWRGFVRITE